MSRPAGSRVEEARLIFLNHRPRIHSSMSYQALGGYYRPEAIMLLRRFYLIQNSNGRTSHLAMFRHRETETVSPLRKPRSQRTKQQECSRRISCPSNREQHLQVLPQKDLALQYNGCTMSALHCTQVYELFNICFVWSMSVLRRLAAVYLLPSTIIVAIGRIPHDVSSL